MRFAVLHRPTGIEVEVETNTEAAAKELSVMAMRNKLFRARVPASEHDHLLEIFAGCLTVKCLG